MDVPGRDSIVWRLATVFVVLLVSFATFAEAVTNYVYPLKVASSGRYLVDQGNQPWRIQADAAWLMSTNGTPAQVDTYLTTRKAQGFNSFYLMAIVHPGGYGAAPNAPNNYNGDPPFATPNVFSTAGGSVASERYWAWIDSVVDKAAANGMVVMLAYTYLGYQGGNQGWYQGMLAQPSRQACTDWGTWLGNRYKGKPNVIWFALGDYTPPSGSEGEARALAIINGIKGAGATQLFMAEPSGGSGVPTIDAPAFASVLDMNSFYGYGPSGRGEDYVDADRAWRVSPAKPAWVQEGGYEYENNTGGFTAQPYETRRTRFWAVLGGGAAGDGFGSRDAWQWLNFPASLSSPGATYSTHAFQLFASLPWWDLRPSGTGAGFAGKVLVTSGGGTRGQTDYVTSALTSDGRYLLAYIPTTGGTGARTVTIDMTAMTAVTRARWFNPATGGYVDIGTGYANAGTRSFTSQANNGTGTNDWVLVLDGTSSPVTYTLTVAKAGAGAGSVTSSPAGIDCGADCSEPYDSGTVVTLSQTAASGSTFTGWGGACTGTGACQVTMSTVQSVTATFGLNSGAYTVAVAKAGDGTGMVTSSPAGISCGSTCSAAYDSGTIVTLTATPATGSLFTAWSGACTGAGSCQITMNAAQSVTATFAQSMYTLTVAKVGNGSGTVTSSPAGVDCGVDCTEPYNRGTNVTLTAAAVAGSTLSGWAGDCSGAGSCQVSMNAARNVVAIFSTAVTPPGGLAAGYGFSEGTGATTADASGNGITGTLASSPAWVEGRNGTALSFNGSSTYVDLGNPAALQLTGSMTLSAWVYETANVGDDGLIIAKSDGGSGWQLKSSPDTGVRTFAIGITNSNEVRIQRYSSTVRALNTWYHVAGVYDASAPTLSIYVNGVLDNGVLSGTVPASQRASNVNANIGRRTGGFYIRGTVDDVRVYGRALSLAEIQSDMNTPVGGGAGDTTPPSIPTSLAATPVSASRIDLGWSASTDNLAVAGYRVFRGGGLVGTVATTSYSDVGLAPSTTYTYAVTAYDAAGNASAQSAPASATTPPLAFDFSLSNGGNKSAARGSAVTNAVNATIVSGASQAVSFTASGLPAGATASFSPTSCSPGCSTTLTITSAASTPIGTSTITVTGTGGSLSRTTAFSLSVTSASDTTPPSVSLIAPAAGATVIGTAVSVSATASDNVGVSGVQFLLDGADLGAEDTMSPYSVTWNTTTTTSGPHVVAARARDAAANSAVSANVNVIVDNQPPTGSIVINGGAPATNSRTATLTLAASDALSGVTQMRFSNAGSSYSTAEAYAPTKTWTLTIGAGTKTVYAQFKDAPGNWSAAATDTIVHDAAAPTISAVGSSGMTSSSATISWTTNEAATSQVEYGTTTSYGSATALDSALLTGHGVVLSGLATQTTYNYRARSRDAAGNERIGANNTLKTLGGDAIPPSGPVNLVATAVSSTQIDLSWSPSTDSVAMTGYTVFRNGAPVSSPAAAAFSDSGLAPATSYTYTVSARDAAGNVSPASAPASASTPPLVITNVDVTSIAATTALVTWSTDQLSNSQVEYGTTTDYGAVTPLDATATLSHARTLSGLTPNTTYHYRARSVDSSSRLVVSDDSVFASSPAGSSGVFQKEILASGLTLPTAIKFLPTGDLLVLQLGGTIRRVHPGTWQVDPTPFLVLTNIGTTNGQQGLMDMALDPGFATNHYYYVFYTLGSPNRDRASRFTANADLSGTVAGSEFVIYQDPEDANAEHHGGAMNFGNDGKLYVTTGEHFNADDAQSLSSPRGKLLRFNPDGSVPTDNPFYDGSGPNFDAIWALGLHNPYRGSYDGATGRLYIGDAGGNDHATAQEEVNVGVAGANYGWPICEGFSCGADPANTSPIYAYPHDGREAAITGGFIYRGSQFPASYYGNYFFADYAQNWIKRLTLDAGGSVTGIFNFEPPDGTPDGPYGDIVYLCEGPDGALYYVDLGYSDTTGQTGAGKIRRIRFIPSNQPPAVAVSADTTEGLAPLTVTFTSAGTTDPDGDPLSYLWTFGDGATSTEANPTHTYLRNGSYTARLEASDTSSTTLSSPITISVGTKPVPAILTPDDGVFFRAGDTIFFSGDATDAEDGVLPPAAFTWSIDFLREGHVHPALPQAGVKAGTFDIPTTGHDFEGNTRYRITLTVTDSDGLQGSRSVIVYPDISGNNSTATLVNAPTLDDEPQRERPEPQL